jgi:CelD/BcsL family acetyltransferase involved in cellulose biosynthesis
MNVDVLTDEAALGRLWPAWELLWRRAPGALPFTAPAWLRPWWTVYGTGRPVVAVLHGPSALAGVLPLYRLQEKLLPMGVGISDYCDVLLAPEAPREAAGRLLAAALEAGDLPRCDLPQLPQSALLRAVEAPAGWRAESWAGAPCPVLSLVPGPAIPKGMRRDLRQARNRADRAGGCQVERADAERLTASLDTLVALHGARWQRGVGGREAAPGVLADAAVLAFHRASAPALLAAGLLRLEILRLHGRAAAVIYALVNRERIFFYLSGFAPEYAFESPGTILLGHMIEEACREGLGAADFLRGPEAYKYAWGGIDRINLGRSFVRA